MTYEQQAAAIGAAADLDISTAKAKINDLTTSYQALDQALKQANETISALTAQLAGTTSTSKTVYGACPESGSATAAGIAAIDKKYGVKAKCIRLFGNLSTAIPTDRWIHLSVKIKPQDLASGSQDAALIAWIKARTTPTLLTVWHEPENDGKTFTSAQFRAGLTHLINLVSATGNKFVEVVVVLMAWTFDSRSGRNPMDWIVPGLRVIGVDFDGDPKDGIYKSATQEYPPFTPALNALPAFMKSNNLSLVIPEFGAPRNPADTDGSRRVAWIKSMCTKFESLGARRVDLFDYPTINSAGTAQTYPLSTSAEISAWKALESK